MSVREGSVAVHMTIFIVHHGSIATLGWPFHHQRRWRDLAVTVALLPPCLPPLQAFLDMAVSAVEMGLVRRTPKYTRHAKAVLSDAKVCTYIHRHMHVLYVDVHVDMLTD